MDVGERIKECRIRKGLSATVLAERLGKDRATVYRYESGDIENVPISLLEPLAKILDTTPAYLMGWSEDSTVVSITDHEFLLLQAYRCQTEMQPAIDRILGISEAAHK